VRIISRKSIRELSICIPKPTVRLTRGSGLPNPRPGGNLVEVQAVYPHADLFGKCIVFNVHGRRYRLISAIHFNRQILYIRQVLTHRDYDQGRWKDGCS
jgi:mRNA interferase HigB